MPRTDTLRILVLTQMYPPHHLGGYEVVCRDVVDRWRERGHDVEVLTTSHTVAHAVDDTDTTRVRRNLRFYWDDHRILAPPLPTRWLIERQNQRALAAALAEQRPGVVSVWHMGAMSLGLLQTISERAIPMVFVIGDDWLVYGPKVDAWSRLFTARPRLGRLARKLTRVPTTVAPVPGSFAACFASDWLRRRALERSPWILGRTAVVPHGIDTRRFESRDEEAPWSWRILSLGRVEERKGVHVAIEALTHLPVEATLDVAGPAHEPYVDRLRRLTAELGLEQRVRFVGEIGQGRLAGTYRAADVFVHPVVWEEPFGLAPLEAMACGTPTVATGTGGSAEFLLDGKNCLLVPRGDARALADALRRLANDAALRRKIERGGRSTAARLDVDRMAVSLESWHHAAAAGFHDGEPPVSAIAEASASELDRDA
ncbi:MAG: glycosyltransferase family 4 protein [Actinomycetota bacterium]